jgi:hypothetical protein
VNMMGDLRKTELEVAGSELEGALEMDLRVMEAELDKTVVLVLRPVVEVVERCYVQRYEAG